jgi:hypothetical protein
MNALAFWTLAVGIICSGRLLVDYLEARLEKSRCLFGCSKRNLMKVSSERRVCCRCGWMHRVTSDRPLNSQR